jgi:uncharacterized SAM-binding protein YcdF (DUF218 family)
MVMLLVLVLVLAGFLVGWMGWSRGRWFFYSLTILLLLAAGCGPLPRWLLARLQSAYVAQPTINWAQRNAIVLLGAGTSRVDRSSEVVPMIFANGRIVEATTLYRSCRQTNNDCKLIVSGGDADRNGVSEAVSYAAILQQLGVDRADLLLESRSMNTWQNAEFVRPLLSTYAPQRVVLVSSATHLNRARLYFAHFGMDPIPVRGDYADVRMSWMPNSWNLALTDLALHEYIGVATYSFYNMMGWNAPPSRNGAP